MTPPTDAVDRITDQWRHERPDLDPAPMGVIGRISRIGALVQRELDQVFAEHDLTGADFDVLATLRRAGAPYRLTPGELSRSTMVTTGGMTKRLDRLEATGMIRREPDPHDRRGKLIALTAKGRDSGRPRGRGAPAQRGAAAGGSLGAEAPRAGRPPP